MIDERYLVTVAAGIVGSHLVRLFAEQGVPVRAIVRLDGQKRDANYGKVEGSFSESDILPPLLEGITGVNHIAENVT